MLRLRAFTGLAGHVDDVFVCCSVPGHCIKKYGKDFVEAFREIDTDDVEEFVRSVPEETREELGDKVGEVVEYAGLGGIV